MKIFLSTLLLLATNTMAQQIITLYETSIPNSKVDASVKEKSEVGADGILRISNVVEPTLTVFLPESGKSNGTAVIICPGGGYWILAAGHEGADVAKEFIKMGQFLFFFKMGQFLLVRWKEKLTLYATDSFLGSASSYPRSWLSLVFTFC